MSETYTPPAGIGFADEPSAANFQAAMRGDLTKEGFRPAIVITSDAPGAGKTTLAMHILMKRFGAAACSAEPHVEAGFERMIPGALKRGYLLIEDALRVVRWPTLHALLTAKEWAWHKLYSTETETAPVDLQVVITGWWKALPEPMVRRSIVIKLAAFQPSSADL